MLALIVGLTNVLLFKSLFTLRFFLALAHQEIVALCLLSIMCFHLVLVSLLLAELVELPALLHLGCGSIHRKLVIEFALRSIDQVGADGCVITVSLALSSPLLGVVGE